MDQLPSLISDLAVILMTAGVITILFKHIKQPVVLGYILAGIIAGPSLDFFHITDTENIKTWADIGVIFLLFSIGLDFSFKKLFKMGGAVFITAVTVITGMMTVGYITGKLIGWSHITSLFLGGMMSMSSTTIIIKTYEDLGVRKQQFAGLVIGMLIVEDLFAVILMVLLSTIAVSSDFSGENLVFNILRLFMFILIWFALGIYLLPTMLKKVGKWLNEETLLIVSVALCLTMVLVATGTGFSAALGAFVMGSLLSETRESERMEKVIKPLKDLFGAVFFVSVGMMINPSGLLNNILPIMLITVAVICGQIFLGTMGMLFSGQSLRVGMQAGFSLAQVGEFAFIIAQLGVNLGVTDSNLYPTIVAVSVITTFFTPFLIKSAVPAFNWFTHKCPPKFLSGIEKLSFTPRIGKSGLSVELFKSLASVLVFYLTIIVFIVIIGLQYIAPHVTDFISNEFFAKVISAVIIIGATSPFMRAILVKKNKTIKHLLQERDMNKGPLIGLIIIRIFICVSIIIFVLSSLFNIGWVLLTLIALAIVALTLFNQPLKRRSIAMEKRFISNLNEKDEIREKEQYTINKEIDSNLLSNNMHLEEFTIEQNSPNIGKSLRDVHMREYYGVNIVSIIRGDIRINIPGGNENIYPGDRIIVVGTDEQLKKFETMLESRHHDNDDNKAQTEDMTLERMELSDKSSMIGKTIRNTLLRDRYSCMVVGIERNNTLIANPDVEEMFMIGDTLLIVGEKQNIISMAEMINQ